jgi:hypothetical protein
VNRPGIISFGLLLGQPQLLTHYLLLYDELWVPFLSSSYPDRKTIKEWDLDQEHLASIAYLERESLIKESPFDPTGPSIRGDSITAALIALHDDAQSAASKAYPTAKRAALEAAAASFNNDIALSRLVSYVLWRDKQELAYPVVFPFGTLDKMPRDLAGIHKVLSIVLKRFPTPSPDIPLEDFVAFKQDADTKYKFARFWDWTRKIAKGSLDQRDIEEEVDWMITDYSHHLQHLTTALKNEQLEVVVSTPLDMVEDLVKIRWGKLARSLFSLRGKQLSAHSAELKLPGSELAYITEATSILSRRHGRN